MPWRDNKILVTAHFQIWTSKHKFGTACSFGLFFVQNLCQRVCHLSKARRRVPGVCFISMYPMMKIWRDCWSSNEILWLYLHTQIHLHTMLQKKGVRFTGRGGGCESTFMCAPYFWTRSAAHQGELMLLITEVLYLDSWH
jgi:hypothetical protein